MDTQVLEEFRRRCQEAGLADLRAGRWLQTWIRPNTPASLPEVLERVGMWMACEGPAEEVAARAVTVVQQWADLSRAEPPRLWRMLAILEGLPPDAAPDAVGSAIVERALLQAGIPCLAALPPGWARSATGILADLARSGDESQAIRDRALIARVLVMSAQSMAVSDEVVADEETRVVDDLARSLRVPPAVLAEVRDLGIFVLDEVLTDLARIPRPEPRPLVAEVAAGVARVDGRIDPREIAFLRRMGDLLRVPVPDV